MTITQAGKSLGISGKKLCQFLRDKGVIFGSKNTPTQKYLDIAYFEVVIRQIQNGSLVPQTRVTASGVDFIRNLLKRNGMVA